MTDRAITKDDLIWVLVRGTGLLLVLRSLLYVPELISAAAWVIYLGDLSINPSEGEKLSFGIPRQQLVSSFVFLLFYGALGVYFLRRADWVFRLLRYVGKERSNNTVETDARKGSARRWAWTLGVTGGRESTWGSNRGTSLASSSFSM